METITKWANVFVTALGVGLSALWARLLSVLGVSWVNFTYVLPQVKQWLMDQAAGLPEQATAFMAACGIDVFMTLIISAIVARTGLKMLMVSTTALQGMIGGAGG